MLSRKQIIIESVMKHARAAINGKNLGKFASREAAKKRLCQIEYFKHAKK